MSQPETTHDGAAERARESRPPRPHPIWHPFTQHALFPEMTPIARAEGAYLETVDGRRIYDAVASWWIVTHGHRHPRIVEAIHRQIDRLDQVIFAGFTHEPAERLAEGLLARAPGRLAHVFFSDSGSTAVEVALKMALGYWREAAAPGPGGAPRARIVVMEDGYHGDTIGTMSIGERGVFNAAYEPLLFDVARIPFPAPGREGESVAALERLCAAGDVAALVLEPLVLGAGGMRMYGAETLARLAGAAQRAGALLIADEVMTGWGRTGTLFACEQAGVAPDLLCLSKGITGGSLPLAVTLATPEIFEAHYSEDRRRTFYHSSSYTGSPVACAAAVANLEIWDEEPVLERIARVGALQEAGLARFAGDPRVAEIRRTGTIAALRLKAREAGYLSEIGPTLYRFFQARDLLLRPLGDTLYVMPPYCSTEDDLARVYDAIAEAVDAYC